MEAALKSMMNIEGRSELLPILIFSIINHNYMLIIIINCLISDSHLLFVYRPQVIGVVF